MYWILAAGMTFFWLCAAVAGWQEGYGIGGAMAGLLFLVPLIPLWPLRHS